MGDPPGDTLASIFAIGLHSGDFSSNLQLGMSRLWKRRFARKTTGGRSARNTRNVNHFLAIARSLVHNHNGLFFSFF